MRIQLSASVPHPSEPAANVMKYNIGLAKASWPDAGTFPTVGILLLRWLRQKLKRYICHSVPATLDRFRMKFLFSDRPDHRHIDRQRSSMESRQVPSFVLYVCNELRMKF